MISIFDKTNINLSLIQGNSDLSVGELSNKNFIFLDENCTLTEAWRQWNWSKCEFAIVSEESNYLNDKLRKGQLEHVKNIEIKGLVT